MESLVENVKKQMSPEELASYERIGKYMYETIDYLNPKKVETDPFDKKTPEEIVEYADKGLKSGLLPHDLTPRELYLIIATYGRFWYDRYGLNPNNLPPLPSGKDIQAPKGQKQEIKRYIKKLKKKRGCTHESVLCSVCEL